MKRTSALILMIFVCAIGASVLADNTQKLDHNTLRILAESQKAFEEDGIDQAIKVLSKFQSSESGKAITPHDLAHITQMQAQYAILEKDLPKAIYLLKSTLEVPGNLQYHDKNHIRYQLAQTYFALQKWDEGLAALDNIEGSLLENWKIYGVRARAHLKLGDKESAIQEYLIARSLVASPNEVMPPSLIQLGVQLGLLQEKVEEDVKDLE